MLTSRIRNKCLSLGRLVFVLSALVCVRSSAETPFDELKSKLDQALEQNSSKVASDQKIAATGKMYLGRLAALRVEFLDQGSLDGVLEVQDEIGRFEDSGGIPNEFSSIGQLAHFQRIYAREIRKIQSEERVGMLHYYNVYERALLKREEELVRIGFIDQAVDVRAERDRVKQLIRKLSRGKADPRSLRSGDVFFRPGESKLDVPFGDSPEVLRDEANSSNEAFDALKAEFEQLLVDHWETVASGEQAMYKEYMEELRIRKFHYQSQGSLDGVLALQAEMKRLEDTGAILNGETELKHLAIVQRSFARDLRELKSADRERLIAIFRQYLSDIRELEQSLVQQRLIDQAILVREERERAAGDVRARVRKDLVLHLFELSQEAGE